MRRRSGGLRPKGWWRIGLLLGALAALSACTAPRAKVTIRFEPEIPLVNEMTVFEAFAEERATIYEWSWTFGDGETAVGKRVWHVFHSVNTEGDVVAPWKVTVTAVDDRGRVSSAAEYVQVQPYTGHLASYSVLAVGSACDGIETREPEVPPTARIVARGDTVMERWWKLTAGGVYYLVVKLHMIPFDIDEVACTWSLVSLGPEGEDWPVEIERFDGGTWPNFDENDPYELEDWYYDHIGFVLELDLGAQDLDPGWYIVFAEATASEPVTSDRNVYSFRIYVESAGGEE